MPNPKRKALNKKLALLTGWERTESGNWRRDLSGVVYTLPPDYCRSRRALSQLMVSLSDDEREATVKFLVSMKEKGKLND